LVRAPLSAWRCRYVIEASAILARVDGVIE
jgi:hypothetical protein